MSTEGGTRAIIAALVANVGIAITKFVAFLLTGSSSMLAESVHSVADSGNQALLLLGGRRARKQATPLHPFGYGRERYFWAFVVSIVLFSVGGLFALYEAFHKFQHPEPIEGTWWWVPIVVLVVSIGLESYSFRTAIHESNHVRGRRPWGEFIRRAKAPELPVVLLEDFAALVGLVFALFGVGLTLLTHNGIWDAVGTGLIGILLVAVAITLSVEMKSLLLGEAGSVENVEAIEAALAGSEGVDRIIHLRTHVGPEELLVAAKVAVTTTDTADEIADAINRAELAARQAVPSLTLLMYIEPDLDRGPTERPAWDRSSGERPRGSRGHGTRRRSLTRMSDGSIRQRISDLVHEEHTLRDRLSSHEISAAEEHARLRDLEVELDQCWDLLRQRQAKQEFGEDPDTAEVRDARTVEGYLG